MGEGLARMATDASAAYLLGYQPEKPPDGDWHRLEVRIRRPGLKVRARRRYLASLPAATATREARGTRPTAPALTAGTTRGDIALRVAAYIRDPDELRGLARIQVAVEVDSRSVQALAEPSGGRSASIDLTIQAVSLGRPLGTPQVDQRLDMTLGSTDEPASWLAVREIALPPGVAQVRALVRDRTSGRIGLAIRRLEIPDLSRPYVGTPILSDRVAPPHKMGEPPSLAPVARRAFSAAGRLYCQFEVFNYGGLSVPGLAKLSAGYTLTGPDGSVVRTAPPTAIDTATNRAVRRVELPVKDLAPGDYLLQVAVEDRLAGQTLIAREAFTLEP